MYSMYANEQEKQQINLHFEMKRNKQDRDCTIILLCTQQL